jgi:galactokinase
MHLARFQAEPAIFAAPGRVNLIGEHTDYAEGFVMPAAIDFATLAAISPRSDGKIVIYSENFGEEKTFDAAARCPPKPASTGATTRSAWFPSSPARATRFPASA